MKKLIYMLLLGAAVFAVKPVCAQSGVNNNSDFHVPVQVPTIPQAPAVTVVTTVAVPELTITPITTTVGANLAPTALEIPAMPPAPTPAAVAAVPAAAPAATPTGGVNAPAGPAPTVTVTQSIPALPPVPPVAAIPELQLSL